MTAMLSKVCLGEHQFLEIIYEKGVPWGNIFEKCSIPDLSLGPSQESFTMEKPGQLTGRGNPFFFS